MAADTSNAGAIDLPGACRRRTFADPGLSAPLVATPADVGYEAPTPRRPPGPGVARARRRPRASFRATAATDHLTRDT
jgi:hypothetical protein